MPDYSEFPTTPTAWQEVQAQDWQTVTALETEDPAPPPHKKDRVALVAGIFFVLEGLFLDGGILWLVLIGAGVALLLSELRKARRRR